MAFSYTRSANLRAILLKAGCPEVLSNCEPAFSKLVSPQNRDSLQTLLKSLPDISSRQASRQSIIPAVPADRLAQPLPLPLHHLFPKASKGYLLSNITIRGSTYSTHSKHLGNSSIMINTKSFTNWPARIAHVLQFDHDTVYFIVQRYTEAGLHFDPYSRYKSTGARLWSSAVSEELETAALEDVVCHFAYLPMKVATGDDVIAVLPLWRQ